jgi:hypothetical protein
VDVAAEIIFHPKTRNNRQFFAPPHIPLAYFPKIVEAGSNTVPKSVAKIGKQVTLQPPLC